MRGIVNYIGSRYRFQIDLVKFDTIRKPNTNSIRFSCVSIKYNVF